MPGMALTDITEAIASSGIADVVPGQLDVDAVLDLVVRDERRPRPPRSRASSSRRPTSW